MAKHRRRRHLSGTAGKHCTRYKHTSGGRRCAHYAGGLSGHRRKRR